MPNKIISTISYIKKSPKMAALRDVFSMLNADKYDEYLYRLIKLIQENSQVAPTLDEITDANVVEKLNSYYVNIIAAQPQNKKGRRRIKKLRRAYYEFAIHQDVAIADLVRDDAQSFQKNKDKKYLARRQDFGKEQKANKGVFKLFKKMPLETKSYEDFFRGFENENIADPRLIEDYLQKMQEEIVQRKLNLKQLEHMRFCLRKLYDHYKLRQDLSVINKAIVAAETAEFKYTQAYIGTKKVLLAIQDDPIKVALANQFYKFAWDKSMDHDVFLIMDQFANLGLHKQSAGLIKLFLQFTRNEKTTSDEVRAHLQKFLDALYATFNALSVLDEFNNNAERMLELKKLKKLIHAFAEKNDFEKKLFNLRKLYRELEFEKEINEKLLAASKRKYAYIDQLANEITEEKFRLRRRKKILKHVSLAVTIAIAISEGVIAAVFLGWLIIPSLLIVGTSGFIVNYYLFREASYETLKQLFVTNIFKDADGERISTAKFIAINLTILSAVCAAGVFGMFTFSSATVAITALLGLASLACPPVAIAVAALLAIFTVIANATLFYCIIADFIKNDRIYQVGRFFKNNFVDIFKTGKDELTTSEKVNHVAKVVSKLIFNTLFLLIGVALCATLTAVTLGLGVNHAIHLLKAWTKLMPKVINLVSKIGVSVLASPVNSFFYWKGLLKLVGAFKDTVVNVTYNMFHPKESWQNFKNNWQHFKENKLRSVQSVFATIKRGFLYGFALINGAGYGGGGYHAPQSIGNVKAMLLNKIPNEAAAIAGGGATAVASIGVNVLEINASTQQAKTLPLQTIVVDDAVQSTIKTKQLEFKASAFSFFQTLEKVGADSKDNVEMLDTTALAEFKKI